MRVEQLESRRLLAGDLSPAMLRDINELIPDSNPTEIVRAGANIFVAADDRVHGYELLVTDGFSPPKLVKDILPGFAGSNPANLTAVEGVLFFTADDGEHGRELWKSDGTEAGTSLVADIFPGMSEFGSFNSSNPALLTTAGISGASKLFFIADSPSAGTELWMADASGASLVLDLFAGVDEFGQPRSSQPSDLTFWPLHQDEELNIIPPTLYFAAESPGIGRELWRTVIVDGNTTTSLVKNILADELGSEPNSSHPGGLILYKNNIYFAATGGEFDVADKLRTNGRELWRTDGTEVGTVLVADIYPGFSDPDQELPRNSGPGNFAVHNGRLYFAATTGADGRELWRSDGTEENTSQVRNIRNGGASSSPSDLVSTDGYLFFIAEGGTGGQGREVWRTDGTAAGTQLTRDIRPGSPSSLLFSRGLTKLGSSVVFAANDNIIGPEVWISDGTLEGTQVLKEIQFGRNSAVVPEAFSLIDDKIFFEAGGEVWRTDGTGAGTIKLDLDTVATEGSLPAEIVVAGGRTYFAADDGVHGVELWKTDGTAAGTTMVRDINPGTEITFPSSNLATPKSSFPDHLTALGDNVFFRVQFDAGSRTELWKSDGTRTGTVSVKELNATELTAFGGGLFFAADSPDAGNELWVSDGTAAGTVLFADLNEGAGGAFPRDLTVVGDKLFFVADDGNGSELWVSDGEVTTLLDIAPDGSSFPKQFVQVGTSLFFRADDGSFGEELWTSDGTLEGTVLVSDLNELLEGSNPILLASINGTLLFFADDGEIGQALWKTDGTSDGTVLVKDILPGDDDFFLDEGLSRASVAVVNNKLYFAADDGVSGREVWVTDGSADGTQLVKDLLAGAEGSNPAEFLAAGETLFFVAHAVGTEVDEFGEPLSLGRELWSSDGTAAGTDVYADINQLDGGSDPHFLTRGGDRLYFAANDGIKGVELWSVGAQFEVFAVNSTSDAPDNDPSDGTCDTGNVIQRNGQEETECTLRAAIMNSNATGNHQVRFDIPPEAATGGRFTIRPLTPLDQITRPIMIDGSTQPGFNGLPIIEIDGSQAPDGANGLVIATDDSTVRGLVINRFRGANSGGAAIRIDGGHDNIIVGNFIGTDITGSVTDPDGVPDTGDEFGNEIGIDIDEGARNRVGSRLSADGNVISGNRVIGIAISGRDAVHNELLGNLIGTSASGTAALGNLGAGVFVGFASGNRIGGIEPGEGNVISANSDGVRIAGAGSENNEVVGNVIGTDRIGLPALGNRLSGVLILDASNNVIGGVTEATRNVISGNLQDGIRIEDTQAANNLVLGNFIGVDRMGTNALGNGQAGIRIVDAPANQIGVPSENDAEVGEPGNTISGNRIGIHISGSEAIGNHINNNWIGTDFQGNISDLASAPGLTVGNLDAGVLIENSINNIVGQLPPNFGDPCDANSPGNTIAGNQGIGVRIDGSSATGNSLRCNSIFANAALGIDLATDGVTSNDPTDTDGNPNQLQNSPIISLVDRIENETVVSGTLGSTAETQLVIDFYATDVSAAKRLEDALQGGRHLGSIMVTTDDTGYVSFLADQLAATSNDEVITAIATSAEGDSSEFSAPTPDFVGADGFEFRTPVVLVPGIFGSFAPEDADLFDSDAIYREFVTTLGIHPDKLVLDPIADVYTDIVLTLQNAGYELGKNLFLAAYDWRIDLAPFTGAFSDQDGVITGVTGDSLTDNRVEYGIDYLGFRLKQAAEAWYDEHHQPLANVHIIAHSMGGLLSRSYMQSTAYGDSFHSDVAERSLPLPVVGTFTMLGVPNQGGTGPWNGWNDNFVANSAYRLVLSKVISHAWNKLQSGEVIGYASGFGDAIRKSDFEGLSEQDAKIRFVRRYLPGLANLLPNFDGFAVNYDPLLLPEFRNRLLGDLNARTLFGDRVARTLALYGTSEETPARIERNVGGFLPDIEEFIPILGASLLVPDEILSFTDYIARDPKWGEVYYEDILLTAHGDGTVPIESLEGLFLNDGRIELVPFCEDVCRAGDRSVPGAVSHTSLVSNIDAQGVILNALHHQLLRSEVSTGHELAGIWDSIGSLITTVTPWATYNIVVDPVNEALLVDEQGNRLGFSSATGRVAEIPNSLFIGGADGIGWIFAPVEGVVRLQLTGRDEEHFVQVTAIDEGTIFGVESSGLLGATESRSFDLVPPQDEPLSVRILGPYDGDGVVEGATIDVLVAATGDVPAERVDLFVDDERVGTLTSEPFQFQFVVPPAVGQLRLRAVAVDNQMQAATAESNLRVFAPSFMTNDVLVAGSDAGQAPLVRVFAADGTERFTFFAFDPSFRGGVRVATGDVNGDGTPDIITGVGAGAAPLVRVFNGIDGTTLHILAAYDRSFTGGVFVSSGDVNGDGADDIITGAGPGEGQTVKVFDGRTGNQLNSFFAYDPAFTGGVFVASGDVNGDGRDDIITGAGASSAGGPHVKVFDGVRRSELLNFFAYDSSFSGGVRVAAGDVDGDGLADIITGAGAGGGPHVKVFDGLANEISSLLAYELEFQGGVFVASSDVNNDGRDDIITGPGAGRETLINAFDVATNSLLASFLAFDPSVSVGVFVAGMIEPQVTFVDLPPSGGIFEVFTADNELIIRRQGGDELFRSPQVEHVRVRVNGTASADDLLIADLDELTVPLTFDGGDGGNDALRLIGQQEHPYIGYEFLNRFNGIVSSDPTSQLPGVVFFYGLEPITDNLAVVDRLFRFPDTGDSVALTTGDNTDDGKLRIDSNSSEFVDFTEPIGTLTIELGGGDDTLTVALGELPHIDGQSGRNELILSGAGLAVDLTQIADEAVRGVDAIDITGSGDNTLTLDVEEVLNISPLTNTLRVRHDDGDTVNYGSGWMVGIPQIIDGEFLHVVMQENATVEVIDATPFQNPLRPLDTNRDGSISPVDALIIVNRLNTTGPGVLQTPVSVAGFTEFFYVDSDGDRSLAPIDVLLIVNFLNDPTRNREAESTSPLVDLRIVETSGSASTTTSAAPELRLAALSEAQDRSMERQVSREVPRLSRPERARPLQRNAKSEELLDAIDAFFRDF